jgi:hypothetical protein
MAEQVPSLDKRGLLPKTPSTDQTILIGALSASRAEEIEEVGMALLPYLRASCNALDCFKRIAEGGGSDDMARSICEQIKNDPYVVPATKSLLVTYLERILTIRARFAQAAT